MSSRRMIIAVGALLVLAFGWASLAQHLDRAIAPNAARAAEAITRGTFPDEAIDSRGRVRDELVPDFVSALTRSGKQAGWVPKRYLLDPDLSASDAPVYGDDLETRVGTMVQGKGFVSAGADPDSVPDLDVRTHP